MSFTDVAGTLVAVADPGQWACDVQPRDQDCPAVSFALVHPYNTREDIAALRARVNRGICLGGREL